MIPGYWLCLRCLCMRPLPELVHAELGPFGPLVWTHCRDAAWCERASSARASHLWGGAHA